MGSLLANHAAGLGRASSRGGWRVGVLSVIMFGIGITMVMPFVFMISASFKTAGAVFADPLNLIPRDPTLTNYRFVFEYPLFFTWYYNSIKTVLALAATRFLVVTMAAYAFARLRFRGKEFVFLFFLSTMMITPDTTIVPRYLLYRAIGLTDTSWALIIPGTFNVFFLFLMRQFFRQIPMELSEAAVIDGCSHVTIYVRIILPLAVPALATMMLFTFIWSWNDFVGPFIFITSIEKQLITVGLQYFQGDAGNYYSLQMAGAALAILPTVFLFIFTQRYFIQGISRSGIKG